ncbi:MAG: hypothetical protein COW24_04970 [Candidatus Kerfeldbacteria bacterium CG15_BIG_FIL_POST_REV_8_21_14_020_45_12]|uniref:Uncharacterized protein n=1 Tax=Candidatus Kerfeldbacteria bacterium CG15_BIG_FIL_POST_REV_8_21_14_020_45_12 TaxID=2014247 RepID=A0A2M7H2R7_9BACT|nr:MAG: hypothetical protein COW24_04970 [Candidatus Kerfeldbacteria bacterium CG15_BIG_FIL_POST_REV_8_21_14_020_45_12]PJA93234.1 MAG: hypothetical protein CO132_03945 [Candidatus Kerfeldbacteria bacterium CG_4_9_14_3_um_filter_45_8]
MQNVDAYIQKIHSSLHGSGPVNVSLFVNDHMLLQPVLHSKLSTKEVDIAALTYSLLRLPFQVLQSKHLFLGQSDRVMEKAGIDLNSKDWDHVEALARARKCRYKASKKHLALFIASNTDVEDIVTNLTAIYIELVKLHAKSNSGTALEDSFVNREDFDKLQEILGDHLSQFADLVKKPIDWKVQLLAGSQMDYSRTVQQWWINIASSRKKVPVNVYDQPIYFVSSNSHSLINVLSGFPLYKKSFIEKIAKQRLEEQRQAFEDEGVPPENVLYYLSRFANKKEQYRRELKDFEKKYGLYRIAPYHNIDIEGQVFSIKDFIKNPHMDPRLKISAAQKKQLLKSNALIVNIAYPLGMASYHILKEVSENAEEVRGVYITGKAAALNANIGDITIPHYVYDHHFDNEIFVHNDFNKDTFKSYMQKQSVLDAQKAVTVRGTYLQNVESLQADFAAGRTIVEMEAGPYLERLYEMIYPERHPQNSTFVVNPDIRLGMAYYVSDTPYRSEVNLGIKRLTWEGLNGTYGISLGIVQDILNVECSRHGKK